MQLAYRLLILVDICQDDIIPLLPDLNGRHPQIALGMVRLGMLQRVIGAFISLVSIYHSHMFEGYSRGRRITSRIVPRTLLVVAESPSSHSDQTHT